MSGVTRSRLVMWIVILLATFSLGFVARQLLLDIDFDAAVPIVVDPVTVQVDTNEDVADTRRRLVEYLFGGPQLPSELPIDRGDGTYTVAMQNGFESLVRMLRPERPNGDLAIYHAGHAAYGATDRPMVDELLARGYAVLVFDMPLTGVNAAPVRVELLDGPATLTRHDHLAFIDPRTNGSPIRYFVEPVVVMLNRFAREYEGIAMIGLSGGGWTTTLAAAIDPRIDRSYPVAGTLPLAIQIAGDDNWGDWEQTEEGLYALADYPDLYVLGSHDRRQLQVLNEHDPCCFGGDHRAAYVPQVQAALSAAGGGTFDVLLDTENRDHSIGRVAIDAIVADLEAEAPGR